MAVFLDLPDLFMRNVLKKLDMNSRLKLRKVNQKLRSFVDNEKLGYDIYKLELDVDLDKIRVVLQFEGRNPIRIIYLKKYETTTSIGTLNGPVVNMNYIDVCIKDLEILLKDQKQYLEHFTVHSCGVQRSASGEIFNSSKFVTSFNNSLASREQPLRVRLLKLFVIEQKQVMGVLPHLCPQTLQVIHLNKNTVRVGGPKTLLEADGIVNSEPFKNAQCILTRDFVLDQSPRVLSNFLKVRTEFRLGTPEDVVFLKEHLIKLPNFQDMHLRCIEFEGGNRLNSFFGSPIIEPTHGTKKWKFNVPDEKRDFCIDLDKYNYFYFCNVPNK